MTTLYKYQVRCITDNKWVTIWNETAPTVCPENNTHTINSSLTTIVDKISEETVKVKEENVPTGENFGTRPLHLTANAGTTATQTAAWPFKVSALSVNFVANCAHIGDTIDMIVGKDTTIGWITANVSQASYWEEKNYITGEIVDYSHPIFGNSAYTCIANTVANASPLYLGKTNTLFWKRGYSIPVTSTVTDNTMTGYYLNITNGVTVSDLGRVISVDKVTNKVYTEKNVDNSYLAVSPSYIRQSVYFMKDYLIDGAWRYVIGESKVGGSHIPEDTLVTVEYKNNSVTANKEFTGYVEFLY